MIKSLIRFIRAAGSTKVTQTEAQNTYLQSENDSLSQELFKKRYRNLYEIIRVKKQQLRPKVKQILWNCDNSKVFMNRFKKKMSKSRDFAELKEMSTTEEELKLFELNFCQSTNQKRFTLGRIDPIKKPSITINYNYIKITSQNDALEQ
jgi:hypothetical protein